MTRLVDLQRAFIDKRIGAFIHFNSATVQFNQGDMVDWEYSHENNGEPRRFPFNPKEWNPEQLNCEQWADIFVKAGFQFAAMTTKHHEGFALWPTKYTDHCVRNASVTTDVVAAYLKAFREKGIAAGLYFSILDLTAGINRKRCNEEDKAYIKGQITELLTNYGDIPFLIVDAWNAPWGGPGFDLLPFEEIDGLVKSLQPDCLLLNIGWTKDVKKSDIVFFENGAGQDVTKGFEGPGVLCQKLTDAWFWRAQDPVELPKTAEYILKLADQYLKMNVNLIMNFSPDPRGLVDENLALEYARFGQLFKHPGPVKQIPKGWAKRD